MRTLRDMNMSKFVAEDVLLFISLIEDLFPAQKVERAHFPDITAALEKARRHPNPSVDSFPGKISRFTVAVRLGRARYTLLSKQI
jgi:hypothetical protein